MKNILLILLSMLSFGAYAQDYGPIINEVSNGQHNSEEFVELLVIGCPGETVDLRGWILDDNNGDFGTGSDKGIDQGHIRFAEIPEWEKIPVGALILIYNINDKNFSIIDIDDPIDSNNDSLYVLNLSIENGKYFEKNTVLPSSSDPSYSSNYSPVTPSSTSWAPIALNDDHDAIQVRKPDQTLFHSLGYGLTRSTKGVMFAGTGERKTIAFTEHNYNANNYNSSNYFDNITASKETPGIANNSINQAYINNIRVATNAGEDAFVCGLSHELKGSGSNTSFTQFWYFQHHGSWGWSRSPFYVNINFNDVDSPVTTVNVNKYAHYTFVWKQNAGNTCPKQDGVNVYFLDGVTPTASAPKNFCGFEISLSGGNETSMNLPVLIPYGKWAVTSKPSGATVTFDDDTKNLATATVDKVGNYTFSWTLLEGTACKNTASTTVKVSKSPDITITPNDPTVCGLSKKLTGSKPSLSAKGTWTSSPAFGVSFTDPANANTTATVSIAGEYEFTWTVIDNNCKSVARKKIEFLKIKPLISTDSKVCGLSTTLKATDVGSGKWTSRPASATFNNDTDPNTDVSVNTPGVYEFTWTLTNKGCKSIVKKEIEFIKLAKPTITSLFCGKTATLNASALPTGATGQWTVSPSTDVTITDPTNPSTTVNVDNFGEYKFIWTVTKYTCSESTSLSGKFTELPTINIIAPQTVCGLSVSLKGTNGVGKWTSDPVGATFTKETNPNTEASVKTDGQYTFIWTVTDKGCEIKAEKKIKFINLTPEITSTITQLCGKSTMIYASVLPAGATGQWSASPSTGVTFTNPTNPRTRVNVTNFGEYKLTWTIAKEGCTKSSFKNFKFVDALTIEINSADEVCGLSTSLKATNSIGKWTSNPAGATFTNEADPNTDVTVKTSGEYTFTWTVPKNATCPLAQGDKTVKFIAPFTPTVEDIEIKANAQGQLTVVYASGSEPEGATYIWLPSEGLDDNTIRNPIASPKETTEYTVTVASGPCDASTSATVVVTTISLLVIPQVFTPNDDGVNDLWSIQNTDPFPNMTVKVFNRWGNIVFQSTGYNQPWDGTYNGNKVPTGTYYYIIDPKDSSNTKPVKGSITATY